MSKSIKIDLAYLERVLLELLSIHSPTGYTDNVLRTDPDVWLPPLRRAPVRAFPDPSTTVARPTLTTASRPQRPHQASAATRAPGLRATPQARLAPTAIATTRNNTVS